MFKLFKTRTSYLFTLSSVVLVGATVATGAVSSMSSQAAPLAFADPIVGQDYPDESGTFSTLSTTGQIDQNNPFFHSLGSNGRACVTCHQPKSGWTITPDSAQTVFNSTGGLDPLFRTVDGANSPDADVSTVSARQKAYSMLLTKGLIRVHLPIPANAEFRLLAVDDPYKHASAADMSLFRRPLPTTNFAFLNVVMWDGRQTFSNQSVSIDLVSQANDAIQTHAQATIGEAPSSATLQSIVRFETTLFTAQTSDLSAGRLNQMGGQGGPGPLSAQFYFLGINDSMGLNPFGLPFNPRAFDLYSLWLLNPPSPSKAQTAARASIARGEEIFNTKTFTIRGVAGLNDVSGRATIIGTCTTCHDTPNVGSHSIPVIVNTGIADGSLRTPDMPLYTLINNTTKATVQTTDPGRALVTGKWADIGKFKVPSLRGLETRSPYMHNGFTGFLPDLVDFYDNRFGIGFTSQQKADLVNFLPTL